MELHGHQLLRARPGFGVQLCWQSLNYRTPTAMRIVCAVREWCNRGIMFAVWMIFRFRSRL